MHASTGGRQRDELEEEIKRVIRGLAGKLFTPEAAQLLVTCKSQEIRSHTLRYSQFFVAKFAEFIATGQVDNYDKSYFDRVGMSPRELVLGVLTVDRMFRTGSPEWMDTDVFVSPSSPKRERAH